MVCSKFKMDKIINFQLIKKQYPIHATGKLDIFRKKNKSGQIIFNIPSLNS